MRATMLRFASLCLFLYCMLPIDSNAISWKPHSKKPRPIKLDMAEKAVDDMYVSCTTEMDIKLESEYLKKETKFKDEWKKAETCTEKGMEALQDVDKDLTKLHMHAICLYTAEYKQWYLKFNKAVREGRKKYGTSSFPYHSIHFLLTRAIQILKANQSCHVTYRRTGDVYTGEVNQIIRFGFFASSSRLSNVTDFGHETCFKILTCVGAYLKQYPEYPEEEVLIPPYEKFYITKIIKDNVSKPEGLSDCNLVYVLESRGVHSDLNCKAAGKGKSFFFG